MITEWSHVLRFWCVGVEAPAVTGPGGPNHSRTRQAVFAAALVVLVGAGGVTARAAYGARGAGGDAARTVATPVATAPAVATQQPAPVAVPAVQPAVAKPSTSTAFTSTLSAGSKGAIVGIVQQRLLWTGLKLAKTSVYDKATVAAVRRFEVKQGLKVTGRVDLKTYKRLVAVTRRGAGLDPRCATHGQVLCIDKSQKVLRYLVNGKLMLLIDVRFGSTALPTREGLFSVYAKSRNHVSTLYHTPMPYALFFSGGQAVHYSKFFHAVGYNGHSHGCVNVHDIASALYLFDHVPVGARVVIYRTAG
jgi:peptidoglycan hydrolase-like protein with peptidoglycan-binding domain